MLTSSNHMIHTSLRGGGVWDKIKKEKEHLRDEVAMGKAEKDGAVMVI